MTHKDTNRDSDRHRDTARQMLPTQEQWQTQADQTGPDTTTHCGRDTDAPCDTDSDTETQTDQTQWRKCQSNTKAQRNIDRSDMDHAY